MMSLVDLLQQSPVFLITLVGVIGLLVGSFLNVVVYRLPLMMQREWRKECLAYLASTGDFVLPAGAEQPDSTPFNLTLPLSRCSHCLTPIKPQHNIPVLSFLYLGGKCAHCQAKISLRYPLVEAVTALLSVLVALQLGFGIALLWGLLLTWVLLTLSLIDFDHQLLPDSITLPILWLGLLLSEFGIFTSTDSSILGAVAGYLSLWSVFQLFKLLTGKEGMGYGDFKLLALLGAWLGWQYLPMIILLSSLVGAIFGLAMIILLGRDRSVPIPFGPYLAAAGWIALLWGGKLNLWYMHFVGL